MSEKYTHLRCPRYPLCQNDEVDSRVFQGKHGHVFCEQCAEPFMGGWKGPECEGDELVFAEHCIGRIGESSVNDAASVREDIREPYAYCRHCFCNTKGTRVYICNYDHDFCEACKYRFSGHDLPFCPEKDCHIMGRGGRYVGTIV